MSQSRDHAAATIDEHAKTIDELHGKLAAEPGADKAGLQRAVEKLKTAHAAFRNDALGCMN
ncbi:MAG TPA: hypothetical protein VMF61_09285 [Candidatus Acidoferrales bacterium]|nr:hypothetical protein [Candidatus Acidoferrales bacterium]